MLNVEIKVVEYDFYKHYIGGRDGIKRRLGLQIDSALHAIRASELIDLCNRRRIEVGVFQRIRDGNYSEINSGLLYQLKDEFKLDITKVMGEITVTDEDINEIRVQTNKEYSIEEFLERIKQISYHRL